MNDNNLLEKKDIKTIWRQKKLENHFSGEDAFFLFRRFKPISCRRRYFLLLLVKDKRTQENFLDGGGIAEKRLRRNTFGAQESEAGTCPSC